MRTDEFYPSTFDCAPIAGAGEDLTLRCLQLARRRIKRGHVRNTYINEEWTQARGNRPKVVVCAVGAILIEDGFIPTNFTTLTGPKRLPPSSITGAALMKRIEVEMSYEAKEAIALLNEAALELHPEVSDSTQWSMQWSGPLEWVNQDWRQDEVENETLTKRGHDRLVKKEVIRIYDHAIAKRSGNLVH